MRKLIILFALSLPIIATCQSWLPLVDSLERAAIPPARIRPVLGLFKNEQQASAWLTVGGLAGMFVGSHLQGKAAHHIQVHGHSDNWDNYEITRTSGLSLQIMGGASYGAGFTYRSKRWYKKNPILFGALEAAALFGINHAISTWSYRQL